MHKTRIFTNSASDIGPETAKRYGITVIPDTIEINGEVFLNGIEITPKGFYDKARGLSKLPSTAHANIDMYCKAFEDCADCDEILCITITSKMSGSYSTALIARDDLEKRVFQPKITIYDSLQVTYGIAYIAIEAAKRAALGESALEITRHLDQFRERMTVLGLLYSLKNAVKGGRIGAVKALCADALNVKVLTSVLDGTFRDIALIRGFAAGQKRMIKDYIEGADFTKDVCVFHANNPSDAENMAEQIRRAAPQAEVNIEWIGSVIGNYTGEGSIGLVFERKNG